jgi:dGTPase
MQNLAPYAMKSRESSGRIYPEPAHDYRTCYQRDRDRVVHCAAFRKLEYKTQVFIVTEGDYYRTRLTHTLEVAQIGRTIGRCLRLNEDLIEAIALAHDLGHPPFGHAGEETLNKIMKDARLGGFNHNQHSFEIVHSHEKRYPDFDGLNLSREVLVGILKHRSLYDVPATTGQDIGEGTTLEAEVVDVADSLAYLNHDVDDGLTSECIGEEDLMPSRLWQKALRNIQQPSGAMSRELLKNQVVKHLIDMQIQDLMNTTDHRLRELRFKSSRDVKAFKGCLVGFSASMRRERDALQTLINAKLYNHYRVVRMTNKAKRIIHDLFSVYDNDPQQLPYHVYGRDRTYTRKEKYQTICNYIASMTDHFALEEHKKLFNPYTKV